MKIDSHFKPSTITGKPTAPTKSASARAGDSAEVHLSDTARLASSEDAGNVDAARIAEIKQAISEGRFAINTGAIADSLLATARDLIASRRQA